MEALPKEKGVFWRATVTSALLGAWFFLVYGTCNWITSKREDVGTWYFEWEKLIPFVPEFVVPYYSLDLFFVGAFFLCRSRREMWTLSKRVFVVIVASGICFLLFPLQLGMDRPMPDGGWTVPLFKLLHAQDLPYNLAPSLHISLRSIFWVTYGRHLRGWVRSVTKIWFILIGVSTLLVWQHHFMDVVTGFLMGWLVMALIPDRETQPGPLGWMGKVTPRHRQLAGRYGLAGLLFGLLALPGGAFLWFGWPAIALGVVGLSYATANPRWMQKSSGTLSPASEWMLLPMMLVTQGWQRRWMKREMGSGEVDENVWFGRRPDGKRAEHLLKAGCVAVLDLTAEFNAPVRLRERVVYRNLGWLDLTHPSVEDLKEAVAFIEEQRDRGMVYVHCQLGLMRSASVAAAWLIHSGEVASVEEAVGRIRELEPMAVLHGDALDALEQLHREKADKS
ncbi:phosphatase PAP2/dual specificity phosphatase family protein [Phragmitibacter flavus]|nr:phosphatase PAP2/dual specificity phosphatase family protein [Phragmitibacter flavus]